MKNFWGILEENKLKDETIKIAGKDIVSTINNLTEWKLSQVREVQKREMVFSHELRVPWYIASAINYLSIPSDLRKSPETYRRGVIIAILASYMHGVVKYNWPQDMLTKPKEQFSAEEEKERLVHPKKTVKILKEKGFLPRSLYSGVVPSVVEIIKYHHERYDGQGYPYKIKGPRIPFGANVLKIFDHLDAGTTRVYQIASNGNNNKPKKIDEILSEFRADLLLKEEKQYNPQVLENVLAFFKEADKQLIERIHNYK